MNPEEIIDMMSVFEAERPELHSSQNVPEAIEKALSIADDDDVICVTGSLYVVAEARAYLLAKEQAGKTAARFSL